MKNLIFLNFLNSFKFLRGAFIFILLSIHALSFSQENDSGSTIGWRYSDTSAPGMVSYASDPVSACKSVKVNGIYEKLVGIEQNSIHGVPPGSSYTCTMKLRLDGQRYINEPVILTCKPGFVVQWPGFCVKKSAYPPVPASCNPADPGLTVGNPTMISTGDKVQTEIDISYSSSPLLKIERTYRMLGINPWGGNSGANWKFSFERELLLTWNMSVPTRISLYDFDGSLIIFDLNNGKYISRGFGKKEIVPITPQYDKWVYSRDSGIIDYFQKIGNKYLLKSQERMDGEKVHYSYDDQGRVIKIEDGFGRFLDLAWDGSLVKSIAGAEMKVNYFYEFYIPIPTLYRMAGISISDLQDKLISNKEYLYGENWNDWNFLVGIVDENHVRFSTYSYDGFGHVASSEHAGGVDKYTFFYPSDSTRVIIDPLGTVRNYELTTVQGQSVATSISQPAGSGCSPSVNKMTYTMFGQLSSKTNFNGLKTCFYYDSRQLETARIEGIPEKMSCPLPGNILPPGTRQISTQWHPYLNIPTKISGPKKIVSYVYNGQPDLNGSIMECANNGKLLDGKPLILLCKKIEQSTSDNDGRFGFTATRIEPSRTWKFSYDSNGKVILAESPEQDESKELGTSFEYYHDTTLLHTEGDLWKVINKKGQIKEYLEYTRSGMPTAVRQFTGEISRYFYDERQHLVKQVNFSESGAESTEEYIYDKVGQLLEVKYPDNTLASYSYDLAHRLTGVKDTQGNRINYTLDGMGNRIKDEIFDQNDKLIKETDRVFDPLNRLKEISLGGTQ